MRFMSRPRARPAVESNLRRARRPLPTSSGNASPAARTPAIRESASNPRARREGIPRRRADSTRQDLPDLRTELRMAPQVGARLGLGAVLLEPLPSWPRIGRPRGGTGDPGSPRPSEFRRLDLPERSGTRARCRRFPAGLLEILDAQDPRCGPPPRRRGAHRDHAGRPRARSHRPSRAGAASKTSPMNRAGDGSGRPQAPRPGRPFEVSPTRTPPPTGRAGPRSQNSIDSPAGGTPASDESRTAQRASRRTAPARSRPASHAPSTLPVRA